MAEETREPRLVQAPGQFSEEELQEQNKKTASARDRFVARPHDGVWNGTPNISEPASREAQVNAFKEYVQRPDIESRESILAREGALPGQFSTANVESGSVDDGKVGTDGPGFGKESDEAKKEAESVKNRTASKS